MSNLSDNKLLFLQGDYSKKLWYITKQNCNFRDLAMMARILEMWNNNPTESFQSYFDRVKTTIPYSNFIANSPHRALKNCEFYGLMVPSNSNSRAAYSSDNLTDAYRTIKQLCNGEFQEVEKYQTIIDSQLEHMNITVDGKDINPIMYALKVLLVLGDVTGTYKIQNKEFKLFVCTCNEWNQFFQSVESIIRFHADSNFQRETTANYNIANDTRFNLVFDNLSYISTKDNAIAIKEGCVEKVRRKVAEFELGSTIKICGTNIVHVPATIAELSNDHLLSYLTAIRTKPFILLAGISGTGKSRIVREFAFKSCPKHLQDKAGTTPGNYCMIEVKPNWHDSTELLGYYSRLGKAGYQFTKFVKFLVKAKMFPNVPFFVCLDEMNLAPVEQYFAEILSILETRKHPKNAETGEVDMTMVKTEPIIDAQYFRELSEIPCAKNAQTGKPFNNNLTDKGIYLKLFGIDEESDINEEVGKRADLTTEGLTLPDNVVIIGTVNMDDTTHQFSRKVIDRAMTIEMNGGNLRNMFGGSKNLEYLSNEEQQEWQNAFTRRYVTADEVLEAHSDVAEELVEKLPTQLEEINKALKGTPFEVSYRVLNELAIMVGVMLDEGKELDDAIAQSVNNILLMKILPRIEGDAEMFALSREYKNKVGVSHDNRLEWLKELAPDIKEASIDATSDNGDAEAPADKNKEHQQTAKEKIQEMIDRLNNQEFTRFWP